MARVYKNITTETTTTLMTKGSSNSGLVNKILISNNSSSDATGVCVDLYDGTNVFYFKIKPRLLLHNHRVSHLYYHLM